MTEKREMRDVKMANMATLINHAADQRHGQLCLYRGQNVDAPLLPKVARQFNGHDSTETEKQILSELRMRGNMLLDKSIDDWALLCIAQHHGAATRLLDWSTNPLVALWMALAERPYPVAESVYVYVFEVDKRWILSSEDNPSPFEIKRTRVLQPPLNNLRVAAQSGWFTAHKFNKQKGKKSSFVPLENQIEYGEKLTRFVVPFGKRHEFLKQLDKLGINAQTLFPGLEGLCKYMSWRHECEITEGGADLVEQPTLWPSGLLAGEVMKGL